MLIFIQSSSISQFSKSQNLSNKLTIVDLPAHVFQTKAIFSHELILKFKSLNIFFLPEYLKATLLYSIFQTTLLIFIPTNNSSDSKSSNSSCNFSIHTKYSVASLNLEKIYQSGK
ncbi:MAG: hypothetical protein Q8S84_08660 [bacterium]|nr:hypothetical protein [bacterium]